MNQEAIIYLIIFSIIKRKTPKIIYLIYLSLLSKYERWYLPFFLFNNDINFASLYFSYVRKRQWEKIRSIFSPMNFLYLKYLLKHFIGIILIKKNLKINIIIKNVHKINK